jgi:hypothetical protein
MASQNYLLPKAPNPKGQAELILAGAGLALLKPKFYRVDASEISKEQTDFEGNLSIANKFGQPMFDTFAFDCNPATKLTYTASKDFGGGEVVLDAPFTFKTALITVNQTKNIVKTAIAGQDGTVKEFMSEGDFVINLKGVIAGDIANQRPIITELNSLVAYLKAPLAIPVSCNFLNEWLISSVVIESYSLSQREGTRNIIDIDINMLSDSPIELSSRGGSNARYF